MIGRAEPTMSGRICYSSFSSTANLDDGDDDDGDVGAQFLPSRGRPISDGALSLKPSRGGL